MIEVKLDNKKFVIYPNTDKIFMQSYPRTKYFLVQTYRITQLTGKQYNDFAKQFEIEKFKDGYAKFKYRVDKLVETVYYTYNIVQNYSKETNTYSYAIEIHKEIALNDSWVIKCLTGNPDEYFNNNCKYYYSLSDNDQACIDHLKGSCAVTLTNDRERTIKRKTDLEKEIDSYDKQLANINNIEIKKSWEETDQGGK